MGGQRLTVTRADADGESAHPTKTATAVAGGPDTAKAMSVVTTSDKPNPNKDPSSLISGSSFGGGPDSGSNSVGVGAGAGSAPAQPPALRLLSERSITITRETRTSVPTAVGTNGTKSSSVISDDGFSRQRAFLLLAIMAGCILLAVIISVVFCVCFDCRGGLGLSSSSRDGHRNGRGVVR